MKQETIHDKAQKTIDNFQADNQISNHVDYNMQEVLDRSDAYYNHKFTSSKKDTLGRDKPFLNISKAKVNIAKRATDIDTKHIKLKAKNSDDYLKTFIANIKLREWMKKNDYATYLNKWGKVLPKSGSAITKYTNNGGNVELVPWNRMICDPIDFYSDIQIEKIFITEQELKSNNGYDQEIVDELIAEKGKRTNNDGSTMNDNSNFIEILEVHGNLPMYHLTDNEDDTDFRQQMHVIARLKDDNNDNVDFTLYRGKETKTPYTIAHWDEEDGRTLGIGVVEDLFETQVMVNYSIKAQKEQLDLASKMIFQTTDSSFGNTNVLTQINTGDVLLTQEGHSISQLNNQADIGALTSFSSQWNNNGNELVSTPDAISGNTMPSNTPLGSVQIQNQEAHSLFEWIRENKGLAIERDLRGYIIPYIKTQLDTRDEIVAELSMEELAWFDSITVDSKIREYVIDEVKKGRLVTQDKILAYEMQLREGLNMTGNTRFLSSGDKTWKEYFKDFEWDVDIEITGENTDKQSKLTTLFTLLQTIGGNKELLNDRTSRTILNKILETAGSFSPNELPPMNPQPQTQPQEQSQAQRPNKVSPETVQNITSGVTSNK